MTDDDKKGNGALPYGLKELPPAQQGALVEAAKPVTALDVLTKEGERQGSIWTSAPKSDPFWRAIVTKALNSQDKKAADVIGQTIMVQNVLAQDVQIHDAESGEISDLVRVVLMTPEGETVAMVSDGCRRSLRFLMEIWGQPPWSPALPVVIRMTKTRRGFTAYFLDVDAKAFQKPEPKKGKAS